MSRLFTLSGLAVAALLAISCKTATFDPPEPPQSPENWSTQAPGSQAAPEQSSPSLDTDAIPRLWAEHFDTSELDTLIHEAYQQNTTLAMASTAVEAALATARIEGSNLYPQVGASLQSARRKQNFIGFPIPGAPPGQVLSTTSTNHNLGLSVSWEIDLWGRLRASKAAAYAELGATEADLEAARLSIGALVTRTWFAVLEAHEQVELATKTFESRKRSEDRIQQRYERGLSSALEVRLARSQTASIEAELAARQLTLETTNQQLAVLLGRFPTQSLISTAALPQTLAPAPEGLPAEMIARRPDLLAAERRALAASAQIAAAKRARYPNLSLTGSAGTASDDLKDLLDGDFSVWSLASALLQPLFQGGRLRAAVDLAEAGLDLATTQWLEQTLQAFLEVEQALAAEARLGRTTPRRRALGRRNRTCRRDRTRPLLPRPCGLPERT